MMKSLLKSFDRGSLDLGVYLRRFFDAQCKEAVKCADIRQEKTTSGKLKFNMIKNATTYKSHGFKLTFFGILTE